MMDNGSDDDDDHDDDDHDENEITTSVQRRVCRTRFCRFQSLLLDWLIVISISQ